MITVVTVVGALTVATLVRTAMRRPGSMRRAWLCIAATCVLWAGSNAWLLLDLPPVLYWNVFRPFSLVTLVGGILSFPGVNRPLRDLIVTTVDGWMTVGGVFIVCWMHLHLPELAGISHGIGGYHWVVADQFVVSMLAGLMARTTPEYRRPIGFVLTIGLVGAGGDLVLAVTGQKELAILLWTFTAACVGLLPRVTPRGDLFSHAFTDPDQRRVIRMSQLPLLPTVYFLLSPTRPDWVATLAALSVFTIIFVTITNHSRENAQLLGTVRDQSTRYRELLSDSRDAIVQLDAAGRVEYANAAVQVVLGHRSEDMIGRPWTDLVHPVDVGRVREELGSQPSDAAAYM
jgi:PAS domain-containing protein